MSHLRIKEEKYENIYRFYKGRSSYYSRIIPQQIRMDHFCDCCRHERRSEFRRINAGCAAVPGACHYLCDVSSRRAAVQMFPQPQQGCGDERLMEMVGRRSGSSGQRELENGEKVGSLGDNEDRLMDV